MCACILHTYVYLCYKSETSTDKNVKRSMPSFYTSGASFDAYTLEAVQICILAHRLPKPSHMKNGVQNTLPIARAKHRDYVGGTRKNYPS
ncbi:hypothetical protein XENTR_v10011819 [Xenopus tropicalis]|nr:hypothetical protein XENTR_v10011819 [Xenopus tropicalis]KAE8609490.1 hypothetical protein XENTR_v10011819 [Xenopus tropicalis]